VPVEPVLPLDPLLPDEPVLPLEPVLPVEPEPMCGQGCLPDPPGPGPPEPGGGRLPDGGALGAPAGGDVDGVAGWVVVVPVELGVDAAPAIPAAVPAVASVPAPISATSVLVEIICQNLLTSLVDLSAIVAGAGKHSPSKLWA
jgi:hypothetical protein